MQSAILAALSIATLGATVVLSGSTSVSFRPYFGVLDPRLAVACVIALGFPASRWLCERDGFSILAGWRTARGIAIAAALASVFAAVAIGADLAFRFSENLNVPLPDALLFYPSMAYVAEISFHAIPLVLCSVVIRYAIKPARPIVWLGGSAVLVALIEPSFQLSLPLSGQQRSWADLFVAVHVFALNLLQLYLFRRYDFASMLAFRLVYYLHWHIVWGHLRLSWLF